MCGIVGSIGFREPINPELLNRQRDALSHRGPDSCGTWISSDQRVGLGHRRLAIVDLSDAGHQPMIHRHSGTVITFNGEIYNFRELRAELGHLGHRFVSGSDTEVILAAYAEWGADCVTRLQGMFAFALYDPGRSRLLLARDRAGEKPLFFHHSPALLAFASEAKALLCDPRISRTVKRASINEYLAYGYVTGENTMFADIHRLLPGHIMTIDVTSGECASTRYWTVPSLEQRATDVSPEEIEERTEALLTQAVSRQLMADVPVGVLLSGGVDSSLVTAIAAQTSAQRLRTFTARFPGHQEFDEGPYARMVADYLGTEHVELETPPATPELLLSLVAQFDDPIADSSMIPTYLVSREIRRHATVALGGDGGDELFGGYLRYPALIRHERLRRTIPRWARRLAMRIGDAVIPEGTRGRGTLESLAGDIGTSIANAGRIFRADERVQLSAAIRDLPASALHSPEQIRHVRFSDRLSPIQRATANDFTSYMVDDVLVKVDRASMLTSLEVRAPFLDVGVVNYAFGGVPDHLKVAEGARKIMLRLIGTKLLPPRLDLTRKQGFSIPLEAWMHGAWRSLVDETCGDSRDGLVDQRALLAYQKLLKEGKPVGERMFTLLFLRLWERHYGISQVT
ncbi:MAG: asparagine synthase (glutamine-hydrolyzing) [Gemmatimonas sp.]|jgi:asparagine synthase (glutamine-hydrolysing)